MSNSGSQFRIVLKFQILTKFFQKLQVFQVFHRHFQIPGFFQVFQVFQKSGRPVLISIEDCVRCEEANLSQYVQNSEEWLLKEIAEMELVSSVETSEEYKERIHRERKESLKSKPLHGKFMNIVDDLAEEGKVDLNRSWQLLKGGFLTKASESFIMAAQEQALAIKWRKSTIEGVEGEDGLCRVCGEFFETVKHIVSGCYELAKKQYRSVMIRWTLECIGNSVGSMVLSVPTSGITTFQAPLANPKMACMKYSGTVRFLLAKAFNITSLMWFW